MGLSELIALCVGIIATIGGGVGLKLAENRINELGTLKAYAFFEKKQADIVSLKLEIINTKKTPYIIRDLNLVKIENDTIRYFVQGEYTEIRNNDGSITKENYCNGGSYSFVVPQQETKQVLCIFIDKTDKFYFKNKRHYIRFYDERGKAHFYFIDEMSKAKDNKWIEMKKIKRKDLKGHTYEI